MCIDENGTFAEQFKLKIIKKVPHNSHFDSGI
jgi:hypothetical protein